MMKIRIGTRGSKLALAQTNQVRDALLDLDPKLEIEVVTIKTTGDMTQEQNLALGLIGGKGLFTRELEEGLVHKTLDLAVHSMKDVPTVLPDGLTIQTMLKREDPGDAFVSVKYKSLDDLPQGAVIGSAALRRKSQLLAYRPDLEVVNFRGNVDTRYRKVKEGEVDATLLALAGLNRLGMQDIITQVLSSDIMLPAVGQGAVGIECCENNRDVLDLLAEINDVETFDCVVAERSMLKVLDGSCRTPIAGYAQVYEGQLHIKGLLASPDGQEVYKAERKGSAQVPELIGVELGEDLRQQAGEEFFLKLAS